MITALLTLILLASPTEARPILFLLTQENCGPCKVLLKTVGGRHEEFGARLLVVDVDKDRDSAEWIVGGKVGMVPQLVLYRPAGKLVGNQSVESIHVLIDGDKPPMRLPPPISDDSVNYSLASTIRPATDRVESKVAGNAMVRTIPVGFRYPGANVLESRVNKVLMEESQRHAEYQASVQTQGHQLWDQRQQRIMQRLGPGRYAEICAESWPWAETEYITPRSLRRIRRGLLWPYKKR